MKKGIVSLVGAGPGEVGLLTIRGKELIEKAEVVVYDRLVSDDIRRLIPKDAELIDVGKASSNHTVKQDRINEILLEEALKGKNVVRLKGGDPFVFGRGGEELELLYQNDIKFEVVPGITSAISAPSFAGIPVSHRNYCSSIHIITGHQKENEPLKINFDALAGTEGTLIFLMGVATLPKIAEGLKKAGMNTETPAALVENGTRSNQRKVIGNLDNIVEKASIENIKSPAIIIVGKVCELSDQYDWFSKRQFFGKKIVVTRPLESEGTLSKKLKDLGAEVIDYPCIKIKSIHQNPELDKAIQTLNEFSWLVFTSKNGVNTFFDYLDQSGRDSRALGGHKIAAIGSQTALEIKKYGITADYVPEIYDGEHLGIGLNDLTDLNDNILILRAKKSNPELTDILSENKKIYNDIPVYETLNQKDNNVNIDKYLNSDEEIFVTFTSASTVEGFMENIKGIDTSNIKGICIGNQTAKALKKYNITYIVSEKATIDSMIEALQNYNAE